MGKNFDEEGYWESAPFAYKDMTIDQVINAVFESGAPGGAYLLTVGSDDEAKPFKIVIAYGDDWQVMVDDDEEEHKL